MSDMRAAIIDTRDGEILMQYIRPDKISREWFFEDVKDTARSMNEHEGYKRFVSWFGDTDSLWKMEPDKRIRFVTAPPYRGKWYFFGDGDGVCCDCAKKVAVEILRHDCERAEDVGTGFYIMDSQHYIETRSVPVVTAIFAADLKEEVIRQVTETEASEIVQDVGLLCSSCDRVMASPERVMKIMSKQHVER